MLIVVGARDVLMAVLILVLAQHDYGPLPVHFVGKTGTAMLMMSIVALIFSDIWNTQAVALYWLAGVIYYRQGLELLRQER